MASTQIVNRQIADGAIDNSKVAAGANIATSKLADGANFIKRDGTVPFTGDQSLGGNKLTNLGTPSANGDAATKSYVDTALASLNSLFDTKPSAQAATTGNINLSNPGTSTFDGVSLSNGNILFVRAQTVAAENGLYTFNGSSSALTRIDAMDAWTEIPGAFFAVEEGSTYVDTLWLCTANQGGTLGTTSITFQQVNSAGLAASNFVDKEIPSGSINGSNTTFTLADTPVAGSEHVYLNGVLQESGSGNDYTISGATITMLTAPLTGEKLRVSYRK
jgi:hypothetical protein